MNNITTFYTADTSDTLITVLEELINSLEKVTITFGNISTGKAWAGSPESGYIGRSNDNVPLLMKSKDAKVGEPILTNSILKITAKGGKILYQGPIN